VGNVIRKRVLASMIDCSAQQHMVSIRESQVESQDNHDDGVVCDWNVNQGHIYIRLYNRIR